MSKTFPPITDEQLGEIVFTWGFEAVRSPDSEEPVPVMDHSTVLSMVARLAENEDRIAELENAINNGNALKDVPDLLEFLSHKLVKDYGESVDYHYHKSSTEICADLRTVMNKGNDQWNNSLIS